MYNKGRSLGGIATGKIKKQESFDKYYAHPNICLNCGNIIKIPDGKSVKDVKRKQFCNHSCSAIYNNKKLNHIAKPSNSKCLRCGIEIQYKHKPDGGYYMRKYCGLCAGVMRIKTSNKNITNEITKGILFSTTKNWQSARSIIRKDSREKYLACGKPLICLICGYKEHVDIAHIKGVSKFSDETLISIINNPDNLIALCPNHHWEYDHGILILPILNYL
jgi:hypothetical protein